MTVNDYVRCEEVAGLDEQRCLALLVCAESGSCARERYRRHLPPDDRPER
jgi:hypothetical protein